MKMISSSGRSIPTLQTEASSARLLKLKYKVKKRRNQEQENKMILTFRLICSNTHRRLRVDCWLMSRIVKTQ